MIFANAATATKTAKATSSHIAARRPLVIKPLLSVREPIRILRYMRNP